MQISYICTTNRNAMATITAFIRNTSAKEREVNIRFRLTDGRDVQLYYSSELKILARLWSNETQSIKAKVSFVEADRIAFNRRVDDIKHKILKWYASAANPKELTSADLESYMAGDSSGTSSNLPRTFNRLYSEFLLSGHRSAGRIKQMRVVLGDVARFERYMARVRCDRYRFEIDEVSPQILTAFERFLADEPRIAALYADLYAHNSRPIEPRGYNTIRNKLIHLRSFFIWARDLELTLNDPFRHFKIKKAVYGSAIYITTAELAHIATVSLPPRLERYRDAFVFQCSIGCRVSDLQVLCGRNINGGAVEYIARKTAGEEPVTVRVPMNARARAIYEKYRNDDDPTAPLLPITHSQVYNRNLKEIFRLAGLDRWVQRLNPVTREPEQVRLCDIVGSHLARKTFIGNIYKKVRDQNLVSELTGHRANSEAFLAYREVDDEMRRDMVAILDE